MTNIDYLINLISVYGIIYAIYAAPCLIVGTVIMSYLVPKHIVSKYFRQPHFNDGDDLLFEHFPFRYYLTLAIAQLTAFEFFARRRKAYELRLDSPRYWVLLSKFYMWFIVFIPIAGIILSLLGLAYFELTGRPIPKVV